MHNSKVAAEWHVPQDASPRANSITNLLSVWYPNTLRRKWPAAATVIVIALAASFVASIYGGPQLLYALFFGMAFHFLSGDAKCQPARGFCSKTVLRTGVALLGAKITLAQIVSIGTASIAIAVSAVVVTILFGSSLSRWLKCSAAEGLLSGALSPFSAHMGAFYL